MTSITDSTSTSPNEPRSRRVGIAGPPPNFSLTPKSSIDASSTSSITPALPSPPLPPRSPLRPSHRRQSDTTPKPPEPNPNPDPIEEMTSDQTARSFGSFSSLTQSHRPRSKRAKTPDKPLPPPPPSPRPPPSPVSLHEIDDFKPQPRTRASTLLDPPVPISKRTHALLELLSSERAYASDLALIRDVHLPLALGQPAPFVTAPPTPPSSGSSSRTLSTASDSSSGSTHGAPMSKEDTRIIFNNVTDIAVFSDRFTARLEEALGCVLEGGAGEDHVGALFLEVIPEMEPLYTQYITKHPSALEHLNNLPPSPALTSYLAHTRTLAQSLTHAWDLPSLLIKPVQRLLKYSLLLCAVIDETPATHGDKANLKMARERMEAVAHGVNEGRRRREVVKEVLTGVSPRKLGEQKAKKKGLNVSVSASVNLGRMKGLRTVPFRGKEGVDSNEEAAKVAKLGEELRDADAFIRQMAKEAVAWARSVSVFMEKLREWAFGFGRVIGVSEDQGSDAFDAFLDVIRDRLLPICGELEEVMEDKLLSQLSRLRDSTDAPERLLEAMYTLEPLHNGLLNINVSKTRPAPQLLEASKSYLALRGQLYEELPRYLQLLHKGIAACILQFANWQTEFYLEVRERWGDLWDALKVEGERQGEAAETLKVWWARYAEVEAAMNGLNIVHPSKKDEKEKREKEKEREREREKETPVKPRSRKRATSNSLDMTPSSSRSVTSVLASLDPFHTPPSSASKVSPTKTRSMQSLDSGNRYLERKNSNESLRSRKSGRSLKSGKSPQYHSMSNLVDPYEMADTSFEIGYEEMYGSPSPTRPNYSRTKSMPISYPMQLKKSASQGRLLENEAYGSANSSRSVLNHTPDPDNDRGRPSRKYSMRRRLTDHFRPAPVTPPSRHGRSPSLPNAATKARPGSSPPVINTFPLQPDAQPMYACQVVHMCEPPPGVSYWDHPFFTLMVGEIYEVMLEAGHPSYHDDLPLFVDDGEDCLLLVRSRSGEDGWALASFLIPVD